ncbi:MAG: hypothetical protein ABI321_11260 [Polyangia bacterium]
MKRVVCSLGLALLLAGCAHVTYVPATAALVEHPAWKTLSAQHRVTVQVRLDKGTEQRTLRGLVAVQRPDRFRLRALGPAGLTLFDLLVRDGVPKVVSAIRRPEQGPGGKALDEVIHSLADDLACAYLLEPSPGNRVVTQKGDAVEVREPGRTVVLSRFAGTPATWRRAEIETPKYHVTVEVDEATPDATLDPAMFDD